MKKAQAAMEFLMTYGWAILVVLIAIGALAYFGVLNPERFLPETCTVGPGISCDDFQVKADGSGTVILRNGMGVGLTAVTVSLEAVAGGGTDCSTSWASGSQITCTWGVGTLTSGSAGSRYSADLVVGYTEAGSPLTHTKTGSLATKYE